MNKTQIRVTIDSEEKKQRAIEILNKHGENIWDNFCAMHFDKQHNSLKFTLTDKSWYVGSKDYFRSEITLDQLDELLTQEKQK